MKDKEGEEKVERKGGRGESKSSQLASVAENDAVSQRNLLGSGCWSQTGAGRE